MLTLQPLLLSPCSLCYCHLAAFENYAYLAVFAPCVPLPAAQTALNVVSQVWLLLLLNGALPDNLRKLKKGRMETDAAISACGYVDYRQCG